ncbi:CPBP family intramembrane metalloprotease [Alkalicella caledoniensis]|uniref:CPBP family intramembrane metalloprotease n=1 Tax=Alkalicella caledoniensis TaxID=2731377 RepID=A0A7G9W5S4_ALKCA|nr:type II CAAX endopeptidase family protein [Alkalicella caledoniensis]QNO14036.1 CPBP family intramembrane metalloprotease [Alkalicella caledoniensis]
MKIFFKTTWNILKVLLIHSLIGLPYIFVVTIIYAMMWEARGYVENLNSNIDAMMTTQLPMSMIFAGIVSFFIYKRMMKKRKRNIFEVSRFKKLSWDKAIVSFVAGMAFIFLSSIMLSLLSTLLPSALEIHEENMLGLEQGGVLLLFLSVGIVAPFIEEIMFRGIIFDELETKVSLRTTIILQGLLFGLYHMNIAQGVYTSVMGIFLGLSLIWTGSIWAPILIHLGNNLFSLFLGVVPFESFADKYPTLVTVMILVAVFGILPFTFIYLYKRRINFIPRIPSDGNPGVNLEV